MRMVFVLGKVWALPVVGGCHGDAGQGRNRMPRVIAVTGAPGALGRRVVDRLAGREDVGLRLVVRDAARAPRVPGAEVTENPGVYADGP